MKHIVFAHRKLSFGGGERVMVEEVAALAPLPGVKVTVLFRKDPDRQDLAQELRERNPQLGEILHIPGAIGAFKWLWLNRPDALVVCNHKGVQRALRALAWFGRRIPTLVRVHEHYLRHLQKYRGIRHLVDRWIIDWAFEDALRGQLGPQPCVLIHPLYPRTPRPLPEAEARRAARRSLGLPETGLLVGYVGQIDRRKDPLAVTRLATALSESLKAPLDLVFAGHESPEAAAELDAAAPALLARGIRLHRLGAQQDLDPVFTALDLYVLASRNEGFFPLTLIEAMEHGVPVVAPTVGGIGTVLKEGEGGFLIRRPDDRASVQDAPLREVAARVAPVLQDPGAWEDQRRKAHAFGVALTRDYDAAGKFREALSPWL
ncbi:MAG: glycosyltransferase family 4 protein [Geothrix sp.]|nr:glycosyltransferase family 4 protein [Geothrix sp.]